MLFFKATIPQRHFFVREMLKFIFRKKTRTEYEVTNKISTCDFCSVEIIACPLGKKS